MSRFAMVGPDNRLVNFVEADGSWQPPAGFYLVPGAAGARVGDTYDAGSATFTATPAPVETRRTALADRIMVERAALMAKGAPYAGHRIEVDDASRANLGGMATTAALAMLGVTPWPEAYSQGWITLDNGRIPLPTPQDAIALAGTAGAWYGGVIQRGRDLKDAVLAAADPDTVVVDWAPFDAG